MPHVHAAPPRMSLPRNVTRPPALATWLAILCLTLAGMVPAAPVAAAFDGTHSTWDGLLKKHVTWVEDGHASRVDYRGFGADRAALQTYLTAVSAVTRAEYDGWGKPQRLAFLINAYNAATVELILTAYPKLESIRDLGSLVRSPWKKPLLMLLGKERTLDDLEHGLIRAPGAFDEPRIHMAVNCASIGCPALRPEAFSGDRLDDQLEDGARRFLGDRSRNRAESGRLAVSKIFDWYGDDFAHAAGSVPKWLARFAPQLTDNPALRQAVQDAHLPVRFLDYDWRLNDRR